MRFVQFKLVGPALCCLALLIVGMAIFIYYGATQIDAQAKKRQETLVHNNIALWISDIEFSLTAWTIWDEAIAKLDNSFDFEWADRNIGASLIGTSRTRFAAILDAGDVMIYSRTADTVKRSRFFVRGSQSVVEDASRLIAEVRRLERRPRKTGIPERISVSQIEVRGADAVLLSATLFQPDFSTSRPRGDRAPILVTAMPIAGSLQKFFGTRFLLDDARLSTLSTISGGRAYAKVAVGPNGEVEVLSWQPQTPAVDILIKSMPLVAIISCLMLLGGFAATRISRNTARALMDSERQMRYSATHDFLTGLANRALLVPEFNSQVLKGPVAVVCVDLDGFKGVNDTYGHAAGDQLLGIVADRLRAGTRGVDVVFRLGGDEFSILMPATTLVNAEAVCKRLSAAIAKPMVLQAGEVTIGASFGLSLIESADTSCDAALSAADAALYRAKSLGHGSVISSDACRVEPHKSAPMSDAA
jgi:diguanylate cyclase (GGDEF)-like protein